MSRVGRKPIAVPGNVKVSIDGRTVQVESGSNRQAFTHRPEVRVAWDEGEKTVSVILDNPDAAGRQARALWGTTRALIQNMIVGVTTGYEKKLDIVGVGYNAQVKGDVLELKVGFANPIELKIPQELSVTAANAVVTVKGQDKQKVGQFAAVVRAVKKPEPYNGKGIKYVDEVVRRKAGKVFGS